MKSSAVKHWWLMATTCSISDGMVPELKHQELAKRAEAKKDAQKKYEAALAAGDQESMSKYAGRTSRLTKEMVVQAKQLLTFLGIPHIQAPSEGEAQAAFMCKNNDVYATASQDADSLLFGSPILIRNLTLSQKRKTAYGKIVYTFLEEIKLEETLRSLEINHEQLINLGILRFFLNLVFLYL